MRKLIVTAACAALALLGMTGCTATSAAVSGGQALWNVSKTDTLLRIYLDGSKAEQSTFKKATTGRSDWKVDGKVSTSPRLRYEIKDPKEVGRITMVAVSIFPELGGDFSHQPEYTVIASNTNDPESQMKPGQTYDLGAPGSGFKVLTLTGQEVSGVTLQPGMKYKLGLTVRADNSETAQVEFKTK